MKTKLISKISILIITLSSVAFFPLNARAQTASDFLNAGAQNNLISDSNFVDINSMDVGAIQAFLVANGSYLASYSDTSSTGTNRSAAQIVYDAAHGSYDAAVGTAKGIVINSSTGTISPKVILVFLQKEQSLISSSSASTGRLNAAMGYQCPDSGGCDAAYAGFAMQVGWGAWQLRYNYEAAQKGIDWWNSNYGAGNASICYVGQTKTFTDSGYGSRDVTFANAATAAVYRYTPHVFDSAYNVWELYNYTYFSGSIAPPPPTQNPVDDTSQFDTKTYTGSVTVSGTKDTADKVYYNDSLIADVGATSWQAIITPAIGTNSVTIVYKDIDGNILNQKAVNIERHKMADINGDGSVDGTDLSIFAAYWGQSNPSNTWVLLGNGDNTVDGTDLSIFAAYWGQ